MIDEQRRARVERGAALLDGRVPGWEQRIDLERLNVRSLSDCPLGQVFGDFWAGHQRLWGSLWMSGDAHGCGFADLDRDFDALTAAWRQLILERRTAPDEERR